MDERVDKPTTEVEGAKPPPEVPQDNKVTTNRAAPAPTYHSPGVHIEPDAPNQGRDQGTVGPDHIEAKSTGTPPADPAPEGSSPHETGATAERTPYHAEGTFHREAPPVHNTGAGDYRADPNRTARVGNPTLMPNAITNHHFQNLRDKKYVENPTGSVSSVRTIIVEAPDDQPGYIVIPTIWDGQTLNTKQAFQRAMQSGQDWPHFDSIDQAEAADAEWHKYMSAPYIDRDLAHVKKQFEGQPAPDMPDPQGYERGPLEKQPMPANSTYRQQAIDGLGTALDLNRRHREMLEATKDLDHAHE